MVKCLYFTYDGLLDPLGQSQILPYLESLSKNGYRFIVISYEKNYQSKRIIKLLSNELKEKNIFWKPLVFRKGFIHFLYRIIIGSIYINLYHWRYKIDLVHLRGGYSGLIYFISLCRNKFLYDIRAFWGQWADGGRTAHNSLLYKLLLKLEKILISRSAGIIVLDESGKDFIKNNFKLGKPLEVIPTSTNIEKYKLTKRSKNTFLKFVYLGGAGFPPYRIFDAILFIKHLNKLGVKSKIDFINNKEHQIIKSIIKKQKLQKKYYSILSLNHEEIFKRLPEYNIGLVFLETGKWIYMSSPTKIGEYLSAGLNIISNSGIAVLDRLSKESECVETIEIVDMKVKYSRKKINALVKKINNINSKIKSQKLAEKYYSLKKANQKYLKIYKLLI